MKSLTRISNPDKVGAPRLIDLCIATARRNVHYIDDFGDLPLPFVELIVKSVERPDQLAMLEKSRPDLVDKTHELWFSFIKRDVFGWEKMLLTKIKKNGQTWTVEEIRKKATETTYRNCMAKAQAEEAKATEVLRQAIAKETQEARDRQTLIVDKVPSSWEKHRHSSSSAGGRHQKSDVIGKMRREAAAHRQIKPGGKLATPNHLLRSSKRQVHGTIRAPRLRRLLEPAAAPTPAVAAHGADRASSAAVVPARRRSDAREASGKESEGDAGSSAKETPKAAAAAAASRPAEGREARTTPKRKRPVTVLLPSKRKK
jgi:hypothetical protein